MDTYRDLHIHHSDGKMEPRPLNHIIALWAILVYRIGPGEIFLELKVHSTCSIRVRIWTDVHYFKQDKKPLRNEGNDH